MHGPNEPGSERRNAVYRFQSLLELLEYYSEFLSDQQCEAVIRDSARVFVERGYASDQETRLQFVKKCEYVLEALVSMKEVSLRHTLGA